MHANIYKNTIGSDLDCIIFIFRSILIASSLFLDLILIASSLFLDHM